MMTSPEHDPQSPFRPAAIAPTFNNAATLENILNRLEAVGLPVIVVNDGATDRTADILADWVTAGEAKNRRVVSHPRNRGKGAALASGFAAATAAGFTHAVTIDTDGQLQPEDIPSMLAAARARPNALVIGARDIRADDYPSRSRAGRRLSNFMIRLECGRQVVDSQCGLRVYPLALVQSLQCRSGYFQFETEIITRAVWAGFPIAGVPVRCIYGPRELRVSHFKPCRDTLRSLWLHLNLLPSAIARRLIPTRRRRPTWEGGGWQLPGEIAAAVDGEGK